MGGGVLHSLKTVLEEDECPTKCATTPYSGGKNLLRHHSSAGIRVFGHGPP